MKAIEIRYSLPFDTTAEVLDNGEIVLRCGSASERFDAKGRLIDAGVHTISLRRSIGCTIPVAEFVKLHGRPKGTIWTEG